MYRTRGMLVAQVALCHLFEIKINIVLSYVVCVLIYHLPTNWCLA